MNHNFDENINRKNTNCEKHDGLKKYFGRNDVQGLWVADMDFKTPEFINKKILEAASNSLYGYSLQNEKLFESIIKWQKEQFDWDIQKSDIYITTGVVPAYSAAIEALCPNEEDEVIVQTPVYPPLFSCIDYNNRSYKINELKKDENGRYTMDLDDLKSKITKNTKVLTLCSPHNPVGRVWSKKELTQIADICIEHNITIISDEIHADLSYEKFVPLASISDEIANITLTLNSAGKTFNIAGLNTAYAISNNHKLLTKFKKVARTRYIDSVNFFGTIATQAAYEEGKEFVSELKAYLKDNILFAKDYLEKNTKIKVNIPEATYLLWLDFSEYNLSHVEIKRKLLDESKVALNDGVSFGSNGVHFFRLNVALSKDQLKVALEKICNYF